MIWMIWMGRLLISAGSGENRIIGFARGGRTLIAASFQNTRMEDVPYPSLKYRSYIVLQICCRCNCFLEHSHSDMQRHVVVDNSMICIQRLSGRSCLHCDVIVKTETRALPLCFGPQA